MSQDKLNLQKLFFKNNQSIELFQLENLIYQQSPFIFYSFIDPKLFNEKAQGLVKSVVVRWPVPSKAMLLKEHSDPFTPIILVCKSGWRSNFLALQLEKKNFKNIFVLEGGLKACNLL